MNEITLFKKLVNECYDNIKTQLEELELSLKENNHVS